MTTVELSLYPWEATALVTDAAAELESDAEYDAWLTAINEAWLDDALADIDFDSVEPDYIPFQSVPDSWATGNLTDEPGYAESVAPYLY
jgi:hypothetical protein